MLRSFFNAFVAFVASVLMCDVSVFGNIANGMFLSVIWYSFLKYFHGRIKIV